MKIATNENSFLQTPGSSMNRTPLYDNLPIMAGVLNNDWAVAKTFPVRDKGLPLQHFWVPVRKAAIMAVTG
jgi:hypothetical protein